MKRVVVTGVGIISSLGIGTDNTWQKLIAGETGIDTITSYDTTDMPVKVAGEVKGFEPTEYGIEKKELKKLARNTQFAIVASKMALEDAKLKIDETNADETGVIISSGIGGMEIFEEQLQVMLEKGVKRISPFTIPAMIANMSSGTTAIYLGAKGPNKTIVTACASGTHSVGEGFELIRHDRAKVMVVGGTEACITAFGMNSFANMKALSTRNDSTASRPFSADRDGFVMGEGAGVVVLEELDYALARGAKIYAEVVGFGESCDAHHITAPVETGEGAVRAMRIALKDAGLSIEDVTYINAHGTSTPANDVIETRAIRTLFGDHAYKLYVSSTKGATGHGLGAAGGIEAAILAKTIETGIIPPTLHLETPDAECDLNYVPNKAIEKDVKVAMSNSLGFGGHNSVIVMKKFEK
ncbi:beta-ketoacyl-ACP synthase II [Fusobacterium gastrosuis]|uniref:beta-ketoacyl-ACP synthase II n=1 Tax=Fusobacterium gastrosuis TaxID=1755100 RepID=UPI001F4FA609|nr:beta-ketoacyl-ACP synthase II [Fusobacterium gastrosuis]MDD7410283.1 beta-ketoacyl-ACP synthase II [Fusobacteriaceae bacterium]MDY5713932.1 beta-ketoacyl-ACP synthase II [Fusobacterium gastrosuis]